MPAVYFVLLPLFVVSVTKNISQAQKAIKEKNTGHLKSAIFFLSLQVMVTLLIVLAIERK